VWDGEGKGKGQRKEGSCEDAGDQRLTIWSYGIPVFRWSFSKCRSLDPGVSRTQQTLTLDERTIHGDRATHQDRSPSAVSSARKC